MRSSCRCLLAVAALMAASPLLAACGDGEEEPPPSPTATPAAGGVPMFRGDPARTGVNPGPGVERSATLLWRFDTGGLTGMSYSPAVVDGVVYIRSTDTYVYAITEE